MQLPVGATPLAGFLRAMLQDRISSLVLGPSEMFDEETIAMAQRLKAFLLDRLLWERAASSRIQVESAALLRVFSVVFGSGIGLQ